MVRMNSGSFILRFRSGLRTSLLVPAAEKAAEDDEFAEVVGGVVGDEERLAEEVLAVAPAEGLVEVGVGLWMRASKSFEVAADGGDGLRPRRGLGWLRDFGPVAVGPVEGLVAAGGWRGEVEDVALGDAEVLEELPGGVGEVCGYGASEIGGKVFDGFVEGGVGLACLLEGRGAALVEGPAASSMDWVDLDLLVDLVALILGRPPRSALLDAARPEELHRFACDDYGERREGGDETAALLFDDEAGSAELRRIPRCVCSRRLARCHQV